MANFLSTATRNLRNGAQNGFRRLRNGFKRFGNSIKRTFGGRRKPVFNTNARLNKLKEKTHALYGDSENNNLQTLPQRTRQYWEDFNLF